MRETSLGANQWIEDVKRLQWNSTFDITDRYLEVEEYEREYRTRYRRKLVSGYQFNVNNRCTGTTKFDILLKPMEIRTLILNVSRNR